ncbi:deacylase [Candidatus Saccharibacteria bacterium]|nr:deacylase [Candidatus Saccharibacteria bacterium]
MPVKKLKEFLDSHGVKYVTMVHSTAYTAQEIAAASHVRGRELAKTVILKMDDKIAMAVLPASYQVDIDALKTVTGANNIKIATEEEFKDLFPGCELGAMPPFGNLYDMEVYVAEKLADNKEIAFNAGSHSELIKVGYKDFENLVKPKVLRFSR